MGGPVGGHERAAETNTAGRQHQDGKQVNLLAGTCRAPANVVNFRDSQSEGLLIAIQKRAFGNRQRSCHRHFDDWNPLPAILMHTRRPFPRASTSDGKSPDISDEQCLKLVTWPTPFDVNSAFKTKWLTDGWIS